MVFSVSKIGRFLPYALVLLTAGILVFRHQNWSISGLFQDKPVPNAIWQESYAAGLALAKTRQKPLMVYFGADWCVPCDKLEETTFQDAAVLRELKGMIAVKVDGSEMTDSISAIFSKYRVYNLPTIAFFVPPDEVLKSPRITGYIEAGELVKYLQEIRAR